MDKVCFEIMSTETKDICMVFEYFLSCSYQDVSRANCMAVWSVTHAMSRDRRYYVTMHTTRLLFWTGLVVSNRRERSRKTSIIATVFHQSFVKCLKIYCSQHKLGLLPWDLERYFRFSGPKQACDFSGF